MEQPKPDWDHSRTGAPYPRGNGRRNSVPDYSPSTDTTQANASRQMAAKVAGRRRRRDYLKGRWFEDNKLIGYGTEEGGITSRVTPRSLRVKGQM